MKSFISLEEARKIAKEMDEETKKIKNEYMDNNELKVNRDVDILLNEVVVNCMKLNFRTELGC